MNTHFFTMFLRRRMNSKLFSGISILNLTAGFVAFILITLFLQFNLNFDKHNTLYDRIYRLQIVTDVQYSPNPHSNSVPAALGRHELPELAEVEQTAVVHSAGDDNIDGYFFSVDPSNPVLLKTGFYSDPSIFDIFTFNFIEGSASKALEQPHVIVLSRTSARKYFPEGEALGQVLYLENKIPLTVSGVYEDLPKNTEWRPEFLLPMKDYEEFTGTSNFEDNYWRYSFNTYVLLKENADYKSVNDRIYNALKNYRDYHHPYLRPLSKVHMNPFFQPDMIIAISLFYFIALLILVLTSINYVNLQIADATSRMREIGIKKSVGYSQRELWKQFVGESIIESLICAIIALAIAHYGMPLYQRILGEDMGLRVFNNLQLLGFIVAIAIVTGLLSSLYPAFIISRFNPVMALKQRFLSIERNGISLKKVLVSAQFAISLFLVIVSFIVYRQANYMITKEMGFDKNNLLIANIKTYRSGSFEPVRERLLDFPEIKNACYTDYVPFILMGGDDMNWEGGSPDEKAFVRISYVSYDYFDTYGIRIKEGRGFSREYPSDIDKCLINETATTVFGWENPIGMKIISNGQEREVIGVVEDYVIQSVHNPIEPSTFRLMGDSVSLTGMYSVRYAPGKKAEAETVVRSVFEEFYPGDAFYFEPFENLILNENATHIWGLFRNICFMFAGFSILISSVGLFGLVLFYCRKKMKEIGIRKVVGFSNSRLYFNLAGEFLYLIIIGIVFSWAGAWFVYYKLPGANKYGLQLAEFLIGTAIILLVAVATISYNILVAARSNAAHILKYE
jgi:putative ABC transport system permease protein